MEKKVSSSELAQLLRLGSSFCAWSPMVERTDCLKLCSDPYTCNVLVCVCKSHTHTRQAHQVNTHK